MNDVLTAVAALVSTPLRAEALAGDASQRRFFRVTLAAGGSVVAARYPDGAELLAIRDAAVQRWGRERGLPLPRSLGRAGLVTVSDDLGDIDLERAADAGVADVIGLAVEALGSFQACAWQDCPTEPFDAAFFRRELAVFEGHALPPGSVEAAETGAFLDKLADCIAAHPFRLVHRDYHVNNLLLCGGRVWVVDFQDMRGGPDTYDLASLLRERAGAGLVSDEAAVVTGAAARFGWSPGWRERYWECAAQRGLKVTGTFLRLAATGKRSYLAYLPPVLERARAAVSMVGGPPSLGALLASDTIIRGL